jgi:L-iditol 2-dehydrogenase
VPADHLQYAFKKEDPPHVPVIRRDNVTRTSRPRPDEGVGTRRPRSALVARKADADATEVLVRIDAVAICATDLEIIHSGSPASILGGLPFNKNFTPGHEYMGTVAALGPDVDEFRIGERVSVEIHAGCGQCKRCRQGMYTSCLNYGKPEKGHRANGFTIDGGFAEYAVNHINTLVRVPDTMSDAEATLVVTAGTSMYGLTELGGLVAGESVVVIGPGPIGLLAVAVAKALGASPVILTGTRNGRLQIGEELGADRRQR